MKNIDLIRIKHASLSLSQKTEDERNLFLRYLSESIKKSKDTILEANKIDIINAKKDKLSESFIQRLFIGEKGIESLLTKLADLQKLESSSNMILEEKHLENGLLLKKISVPLGVILIIYEARPEVTIDVAALCIKSGNVAILKGGSEAFNTNKVFYSCIAESLQKANLAKESVSFIEERTTLSVLLKQSKYIDLVIARGGYEMVKKVMSKSAIPVLAHASGGARIYIDKSANLSQALEIVVNAKISKPAACNSLDTILIHKDVSDSFIMNLIKSLQKSHVTVLGDEYITKIADIEETTAWNSEFLNLTVSLKRVANVDEAIIFINKYTKGHSEGIIAEDGDTINTFKNGIDTAAIFINCSTRFHDGYEFGFGSEMGIATGKLHARGPVGIKELRTYKWEVYGNGQIRK